MRKPATIYSKKFLGVEVFATGILPGGRLIGRSACRIIGGDHDARIWSLHLEFRNGWTHKGAADTSDAIRWVALGVLPPGVRR